MSSTSTSTRPHPVTQTSRLPHWRWLWLLVGLAVVAGLAVLATLGPWRPSAVPTPVVAPPLPPITAAGTVLPNRRATLSFTTGGRISRLFVAEGDQVMAGQPLARLDPASLAVDPLVPASAADVYLTAPFAGTVGQLYARQWETVTPGKPVVALGDLQWLRVEIDDLAEADVGQVWVGQPVEMTFEALPGRAEQGTIAHITPMATEQQGRQTFRIVVDFAEPAVPQVRWGMTVNVDIIVAEPTGHTTGQGTPQP